MRPYFDDGGGYVIYHGDAREVLPVVVDAHPPNVVLMDPPFGIGWSKGIDAKNGSRPHAGIQGDHDTSLRDDILSALDHLPCLVFGSLYAPFPPELRHICIWEKPRDAGLFGSTTIYRRNVEGIFLTGAWPKEFGKWNSVLRSNATNVGNPSSVAGKTGHPHAKPIDLLCALLLNAPAGRVLDPFLGSGSTLVAAKQIGRPAVGIEIEERYCEVAAQRLQQQVLAL